MEHIKSLIKTGDVKGAMDELKKLMAVEPENVEAMMLYGTCCHLLGDDDTFKNIHDELAPKMTHETDSNRLSHWQKYRSLYGKLAIAAMVAGAVAGGAYYYLRDVGEMPDATADQSRDDRHDEVPERQMKLYGGPGYYERQTVEEWTHKSFR